MDYKGLVCPVCQKSFEKGDDIVVCPICGTPHHRECYEETGHCINLNRHREKYDYKRELEVNADSDDSITCINCKSKNPADSRFCNSCGKPLNYTAYHKESSSENNNQKNSENGFDGTFVFDPLGGVKSDEDLGDGVTAGEVAKFTKTSTSFYVPQFKRIKEGRKARFSFVGLIFGGGWMLYRKMYKTGIIFTVIMALLTLCNLYISVCHENAVNEINEKYNAVLAGMYSSFGFSAYSALGDFFTSLTTEQLVVCLVSTGISLLMIAIRILCAVLGNRMYYRHTIKSIKKIKTETTDPNDIDKNIAIKGGVNIPLALSLMVSYYIIVYLPMFL